jgi:hypothetical protein
MADPVELRNLILAKLKAGGFDTSVVTQDYWNAIAKALANYSGFGSPISLATSIPLADIENGNAGLTSGVLAAAKDHRHALNISQILLPKENGLATVGDGKTYADIYHTHPTFSYLYPTFKPAIKLVDLVSGSMYHHFYMEGTGTPINLTINASDIVSLATAAGNNSNTGTFDLSSICSLSGYVNKKLYGDVAYITSDFVAREATLNTTLSTSKITGTIHGVNNYILRPEFQLHNNISDYFYNPEPTISAGDKIYGTFTLIGTSGDTYNLLSLNELPLATTDTTETSVTVTSESDFTPVFTTLNRVSNGTIVLSGTVYFSALTRVAVDNPTATTTIKATLTVLPASWAGPGLPEPFLTAQSGAIHNTTNAVKTFQANISTPLTLGINDKLVLRYKATTNSGSSQTVYLTYNESSRQTWVKLPNSLSGASDLDHSHLVNRELFGSHTAASIATNVTGFSKNLSSADTTVQKALNTLDALSSDHMVKASSTDTGYGALIDKLKQGNGITFTVVTESGVKKVKIDGVPASLEQVNYDPSVATSTTANLVQIPGAESSLTGTWFDGGGGGMGTGRVLYSWLHNVSLPGLGVNGFTDIPDPATFGYYAFWPQGGVPSGGNASMYEIVNLSAYATTIDAGNATGNLSAVFTSFEWPVGLGIDHDVVTMTARFYATLENAQSNVASLGASTTIGVDLDSSTSNAIPVHSRYVRINMDWNYRNGAYANYAAWVDNVSFTVTLAGLPSLDRTLGILAWQTNTAGTSLVALWGKTGAGLRDWTRIWPGPVSFDIVYTAPNTSSGLSRTVPALAQQVTTGGFFVDWWLKIGAADTDWITIRDYVLSNRRINGYALSSDVTLTAADVGAVPTTRTVNTHALSADVTLTAADVNAVPTTRTVNGHALTADVTVTGEDLTFIDSTTNNSSITNHGFLPKLDSDVTHFLRGDGAWATPSTGNITTIYEKDWSALTSTGSKFVNGANLIDGYTWTAENMANATQFQIVNGSGLVMQANTTNSQLDTTRTTPLITCPITSFSSLLTESHVVEIRTWFMFTNNQTAASDTSLFGYETNPYNAADITRFALARGVSSGPTSRFLVEGLVNGTRTTAATTTNATHDVIMLRWRTMSYGEVYSGASSAGAWPNINALQFRGVFDRSLATTTFTYVPSLAERNIGLILTSYSANTNGTFITTVNKIRIQARV